jgi:hypothetical protein
MTAVRILIPILLTLLTTVGACSATLREGQDQQGTDSGRPAVTLYFWLRSGAPADLPPHVKVHEHLCGYSASAVVNRIPRDDPILEAELVVEYDDSGTVLERWNVPIDSYVAGVAAQQILVDYRSANDTLLAVWPSGEFELIAEPAPLPAVQQADCPAFSVFGVSVYVRCWRFKDLHTGEPRQIAYEGPCT